MSAPHGKSAGRAPDREEFVAREAIITGETVTLTPEQATARKRRSAWIAIALFAFVILVFVITMTRMSPETIQNTIGGGL